ncbi:MAG: class I SAM-dependent methyltransferase [Rhizobiaceae bacterium]|nr:class I SAM-dependent methyltransferase [Rhizobiaceae bacterium]
MSFSTAWLDLREGTDNAARDALLLADVRAYLAQRPAPLIVDLGSGTGSTLRAIGDVPGRWRLVDHDPALLAEAARRSGPTVETVELDLTRTADIPLEGAALVTASALFDLASASWIDALADRLSTSQTGLYAALSYDGVLEWSPADPDDAAIRDAFNAHQRGEKGFGPALGPSGASHLADAMRRRGYRVTVADSPWKLGPAETELQRALVTGIADAARELDVASADAWRERRLAAAPSAHCTVGHLDVLALPA